MHLSKVANNFIITANIAGSVWNTKYKFWAEDYAETLVAECTSWAKDHFITHRQEGKSDMHCHRLWRIHLSLLETLSKGKSSICCNNKPHITSMNVWELKSLIHVETGKVLHVSPIAWPQSKVRLEQSCIWVTPGGRQSLYLIPLSVQLLSLPLPICLRNWHPQDVAQTETPQGRSCTMILHDPAWIA